ncbi:DUF1178 family protein [Blastomonas sp. AAP53]|uniref:DUF1178 family protein n=1 Tax=Blastomonas sp. AAP53 TaxID=1248760 RepID=UPI00030EB897|nr:DUF1178 family protein [Blastomonas sp. AAP53]
MIVYDLKCAGDHVFEVWFASSEAYEEQRARGLVACAFCGSTDVAKAVMAPRLNAKGNQRSQQLPVTREAPSPGDIAPVQVSNAPPPADIVKMQAVLQALAQAQAKALEQSTWVGKSFADRARAMHYGEEEHAAIHGQAAPEDAAALIEEGVAVAPLPFPVVPPESKN